MLKRFSAVVAAAAFVAAMSSAASASSVTIGFYNAFADEQEPSTPAPWLTAVFDDEGTPGSVKLVLSVPNTLNAASKFTLVYFNVDPVKFAVPLTFDSPAYGTVQTAVNTGDNTYKADGDGFYDVLISFPSSGTTFGAGDSATFVLKGTGLVATDFLFGSQTKNGGGLSDPPYMAAAHLQAVDGSSGGSTWLYGISGGGPPPVVPLPAAVWSGMSMLGALGVGAAIRKRLRRA